MAPTKPFKPAFEQYINVRLYQPALAFSPDGSEIVYSTNTSGQFNLWRQSSDGGYPYQLTTFNDETVREISWSPDGKNIAFVADPGGDEFYQLYVIGVRGGVPTQVTDAPKVQHLIGPRAWSPSGKALAYSANDRSQSDRDVLVYDVAPGKSRKALEGSAYYHPGRWSPNGKFLTVVDFRSNTDSDILLLNPKTGKHENLTAHDGEIVYSPNGWAPDGSGFWILSDEGREFMGIGFFHVEPRKLEWIETPEWDVEHLAPSEDGRFLAWSVNVDGYSRLHVRDLKSNRLLPLPELPKGTIGLMTFAPDSRRIGLVITTPTSPLEVMVLDLQKKKLTRLTYGWIGEKPLGLHQPKLIRFETHDGKKIPAYLFKPKGTGTFPVILSIHGGPEAQERPAYTYSGLYQYLLSRGIGILAPNVRGSTGYGRTYQQLIHRDWGGDELKDFEAAAKYLRSLPWVDSKRIGVFGGSFGGFATLSCVTRLPDYWACAVDIVGPSNLVTFAKAVPPTWKRFMKKWVGDPETEVDFLMSRSPITYVDQVKVPLFIIQGANDPRVVKGESDQIVEKLKARGVEVEYDVYDDEGHGFTKRSNLVKAWRDTAAFFEKHLLS